MTTEPPAADLGNEELDLRRLAALEAISASKLTLRQATQLAELHEEYGTLYERQLAAAREQFQRTLAGPDFEFIRGFPPQDVVRQQLDQLSDYRLPERVSLITPEHSRQIRGDLSNRLATASALRRHAERNAGVLSGKLQLAENIWQRLSPADREWRMAGECADLLEPLRVKSRDCAVLAREAEEVFWALKNMLDVVSHIMVDWDRCRNRDAAEREAPRDERTDSL